MLRGYQWSHQLQIIQEFFIITTPIVKQIGLYDKEPRNLASNLLRNTQPVTVSDKILTATHLNFAILANEAKSTKRLLINKMRVYSL